MLSRRFDRLSFLPDTLDPGHLPSMHLAPDWDDGAPEVYSERFLQARLAEFWRRLPPALNAGYIPTVAEERYEQFCTEFLVTLPAAFAIEPSKQWDERLQRLAIQRQILHISIYDMLCHDFRGLLLHGADQVRSHPAYKQVLFSSLNKALAAAVLDGISKLHTMLGGSHTKFPGIILPTFEAAVVLVGVCKDAKFPAKSLDGPLLTYKNDSFGSGKPHVSRQRCIQAAKGALVRLRTLAEFSDIAEGGANTLCHLLSKRSISCSPNDNRPISPLSADWAAPPLGTDTNQSQQPIYDTSSWPLSLEPPLSTEMGPLSKFLFTPSSG
jgi:hypothetical protein